MFKYSFIGTCFKVSLSALLAFMLCTLHQLIMSFSIFLNNRKNILWISWSGDCLCFGLKLFACILDKYTYLINVFINNYSSFRTISFRKVFSWTKYFDFMSVDVFLMVSDGLLRYIRPTRRGWGRWGWGWGWGCSGWGGGGLGRGVGVGVGVHTSPFLFSWSAFQFAPMYVYSIS